MLLWHADGVLPKRDPPPLRAKKIWSASGNTSKHLSQPLDAYQCLTLSLFLAAATLAAGCCALLRSLADTALLSDDSSLGTCDPGLRKPAQHSWAL